MKMRSNANIDSGIAIGGGTGGAKSIPNIFATPDDSIF
jgi:hypothetical protein